MKNLILIFCLSFSLLAFSQNEQNKVLIKGKVSVDSSHVKNILIMVSEYRKNTKIDSIGHNKWDTYIKSVSSFLIDSVGNFSDFLEKNTIYKIGTYLPNFYDEDTLFNTYSKDTIIIDLNIRPKIYEFSERKASESLKNGKIQLLIFDSLLYQFNLELKYTQKFGFEYLYFRKPDDGDFLRNMYDYNTIIENYLDSLYQNSWRKSISFTEDSLLHLEADYHTKLHPIDITLLKISPKLPEKMRIKIEKQKSEYNRLFVINGGNRRFKSKELKQFTVNTILSEIDKSQDYFYIFLAEHWQSNHYEEMIPELIKRITDIKEIGLKNTADLIIWERIMTGDLVSYGHGYVVSDDLFCVAGRANHLLKQITGEDFGSVHIKPNLEDLVRIQNRWLYWLKMIND